MFWYFQRLFYGIKNFSWSCYLECQKLGCREAAQTIAIYPSSKWRNRIVNGLRNSNFTPVFIDTIANSKAEYDLILPITIEALTDQEIRNRSSNCSIPLPSIEAVRLCDDKYRFNTTLIANGFEDIIPTMNKKEYPYILKKKKDEWGQNTFLIFNETDEIEHAERISSSDYFTQEIITGKVEYATHILFKKGRILSAINIKYIFRHDFSIKGKDEEYIKTIAKNKYLDIFTNLLSSIDFQGICCVNYKIKEDKPYIIEINPRLGGSLPPYLFLMLKKL